jgi:alkylation response protein AidB-like acyl-CoA dehydrogenase
MFESAGNTPRIGLSEEQAQLIDVAAAFCRDKSPMDKVRALIDEEAGFDADIWAEMAELGWTGIAIPEEFGGIGLGLGEIVPLVEYMGRHMMASPYLSTVLAGQAILRGGTEAQKQDYLPQIAAGGAATLALCEDHADWNMSHITCTAQREESSDGAHLVLAGKKYLVANAASAQLIVITVMFEGAPAIVIAEADRLAGHMQREQIIDETQRSYVLNLNDVRLPESALMDAESVFDTLAHIELTASLLLAADMCGGAYACVDYTLDYLTSRKQFGKLIGSYQSLKHTMVDAHQAYERARSHLYSAAFLVGQQGEGEMAVRMAKAEAGEAMSFAADRAIQFHGGFGFTYDCDAQLYRRRAIMGCALHGDARYHRRKLADLMF